MKTLIVGLGNPILGDDGIGWRVAEEAQRDLNGATYEFGASHQIDFDFLSLGGIQLMEHLIGYDRAIIVDAITTGKDPIGTVTKFPLSQIKSIGQGHLSSPHDASLPEAIEMGKLMGAQLPDLVTIIAIEAQNVYDFSEELSIPVEEAVPVAINEIKLLLKE
ncbi:MAG: hydrogenase maturation protease [Chloroflexi bacterium]|nr:hydrogenase maturation protease [Chloroflexota bacterium]